MAYVKILNISSESHLGRAVEYAMNPEKTSEADDMSRLVDYTKDGKKTLHERYVTGINCTPDTAAKKMATTKKRINKTGGRQGYQIIQSFAPGEVTPELAHQIAVEYAEKFLGDFEVVIGTHIDRDHVHSHIAINSVSCVDGHKLHMSKNDFHEKIRGISDDLCRKYDLSVIDYGADLDKPAPKRRQDIIADIESCIKISGSVGELYVNLENMGYTVDPSGAHAKIRPPDGKKNWRLDTLGYTPSVLKQRINGETIHHNRVFKARQRFVRKPLTRFQALYLHYMYLLGKIKPGGQSTSIPQSEYIKFNKYKEQLRFVTQHNISSIADLKLMAIQSEKRLRQLDIERMRLRGAMRKFNKLFAAHSTYERYSPLVDMLDDKQRAQLKEAIVYMDMKGYAGRYEAIKATRIAINNAREKNRSEILLVKRQALSIQRLYVDHEQIRNTRNISDNYKAKSFSKTI